MSEQLSNFLKEEKDNSMNNLNDYKVKENQCDWTKMKYHKDFEDDFKHIKDAHDHTLLKDISSERVTEIAQLYFKFLVEEFQITDFDSLISCIFYILYINKQRNLHNYSRTRILQEEIIRQKHIIGHIVKEVNKRNDEIKKLNKYIKMNNQKGDDKTVDKLNEAINKIHDLRHNYFDDTYINTVNDLVKPLGYKINL